MEQLVSKQYIPYQYLGSIQIWSLEILACDIPAWIAQLTERSIRSGKIQVQR